WMLCIMAGSLPESVAQKPSATPKHGVANAEAQALDHLLEAAQQAIDKQDYASAAQNYQDYLAKKPDDATVHYDLGYAYTALHKPADAKTEYEKTISLDTKMASAYQNLGLMLLTTDPCAAVAPLQKASELLPEDARTKF